MVDRRTRAFSFDSHRATGPIDLVVIVGWTVALLVVVLLLPALAVVRVPLALPFVFFCPGYGLICALYPGKHDLDGTIRLTLSFGLSIALIPLLALALSYLPWGVRPVPVVISLSVLVLALAVTAGYRRSSLPESEAFSVPSPRLRPYWSGASQFAKVLAVSIPLLVLMLGIGISVATTQSASERFTEFYLLDTQGEAQDYPSQASVGQPVTLTVGIVNREGSPVVYRLEVDAGGQPAAQLDNLQILNGQRREQPIAFRFGHAGPHQEVDFLLFRQTAGQPYRSLRLWVDVT